MPTLLLQDGFKFFFYANEHESKHIHVMKGGNFAKIELSGLRVSKNYLRPAELKKALAIVKNYREEFERRWDEYFQG
ncbi:DUF4160 domain-containing protein [Desulfonema magnum]|uniref:DUF4160 n=1 Tax=Desulfonema magnum TaxID=45655 RepID=A0A975GND3_9BACT|nr:DUF4160 domain-containing protein [Desulfonema magnum]QTA87642.1 DUF4160 [Desulfonema magnum]